MGIECECVTGETPPLIRASILDDFKAGRIRALINVDVLTTGFDHPSIDLIAVMRATKSTSLWVQMVGRELELQRVRKIVLSLTLEAMPKRMGQLIRFESFASTTQSRIRTR